MSATLFVALAAGCIAVGQLRGLPDFVKSFLGAAAAFSVLEAADEFIPYPVVS